MFDFLVLKACLSPMWFSSVISRIPVPAANFKELKSRRQNFCGLVGQIVVKGENYVLDPCFAFLILVVNDVAETTVIYHRRKSHYERNKTREISVPHSTHPENTKLLGKSTTFRQKHFRQTSKLITVLWPDPKIAGHGCFSHRQPSTWPPSKYSSWRQKRHPTPFQSPGLSTRRPDRPADVWQAMR